MKNTALILFLIGISFQFTHAQQTRLDSSYVFDWLDEEWVNTRYFDREWINETDYINYNYRLNDNNNFYLHSRSENTFDDQGNIKRSLLQDYDTIQNVWVDDFLANYTFNTANQEVENEFFIWDTDLNDWDKFQRNEFFYVSEHDEQDRFIRYNGDPNNEWAYNFSLSFEYFFVNDKVDSLRSKRHRSGEIDTLTFQAQKFIYNADGLRTHFRNHRVNLQDTLLYLIEEQDYFYNDKNLLERRNVALANGWQDTEPRNEYYLAYDENDKLLSECALEIIDGTFVNNWKITYVYEPFSVLSTKDLVLDINTRWSNSSLGKLDLSIDNTSPSEDMRMFIVNTNGQILKSLKLPQSQVFETTYYLPSGIYAWIIEDATGKIKTEKLIVH